MECQKSNVKQKTGPLAQDEKEQGQQLDDPSSLPSVVGSVNGGECDDFTKSQKCTKKKKKNKKKKKKTGEIDNAEKTVDIGSTSQSLPLEKKDENTCIPPDHYQDHMEGWDAKRSTEHESEPSTRITVGSLPGEYDDSKREAANSLSFNKTADQIGLQTGTQSECRDKVSTKIIGQQDTEMPLEDVTTQESSGSQLEVTEPSLQGEGEYFGLNVKKKRRRKKKNKKHDMQEASVTEVGAGECATTTPVEKEISGSLDASNIPKLKKDSRIDGIPALKSEEPDKIAPGPKVIKEVVEDVPKMVKEDEMCPVMEGTESFKDAEADVKETASSTDGVMSLDLDGNASCDAIESTSVLDETEDITAAIRNQEERNILCVLKLIYGVGLRALRKLFMEINPSWSNSPSDAAGIDRGKMKLGKEDELCFNTGKIDDWDFSLITTVLLFSKTCSLEIAKRSGHELALRGLKVFRNKLLGHTSSERMSDADFNLYWPPLSANFETLGVDPDDITKIKLQSDEVLHSGDYYRKLFLTENEKRNRLEVKVDAIGSKLDAVLASQSESVVPKAPLSPKSLSGSTWDEWLKFCDAVDDFQASQKQFILVSDALSPKNLEFFSRLRSVSWKMVLDLDLMSEEKGFYREFTSKEGQSNLVTMFTPADLQRYTMISLIRQIDPRKTQWLFVNGRNSDTNGKTQSFPDWEATSVKQISRFFGCCSEPDKFDKQKPIVCLILPFREEILPFLEVTLSRLVENFHDYDLRFLSFQHDHSLRLSRKFTVRNFDLSPELVSLGLTEMLRTSTTQKYRMPTSHAGVPARLSQNEFLYLKEHLEILYDGCEDLAEFSDDHAEADDLLKNFLEDHRRSFMSGNQISFVSLYDNHDARREIEKDIQIHVQRLLDQGLTRAAIVEIRHSPGTGGTTIARRVLWDIHKAYPCAFAEISSHYYYDEDSILANKLVDRIAALEETCLTTPVILIDGKHLRVVEGLSNKVVRMLGKRGKRALILRCLHGSKSSGESQESSHVHRVFHVNVKLEDSIADLNEFESKYEGYIQLSLGDKSLSGPCRVFHFPLLAMMLKFRPKLKRIVEDTMDVMGGIQQEIAIVVAFLQRYANQRTPAFLLFEAFKNYIRVGDGKAITYGDIKQLCTEHLLNLMVPTKPLRRKRLQSSTEPPREMYTLQHPLVAELVLKKVLLDQNQDLFEVVRRFLQLPIYHQGCQFNPIFEELFVYNKDGQKKLKFSVLFEELRNINSERAAEIFCEAAEKTNEAVIFSNAARFFAKKEPPSFPRAMELMERAFKANNAKGRHKSLCHTKGVVLYIKLLFMINKGKVNDLQKLEDLASKVLEAYSEARNFPPTYPNPLIGEVEVWLACIGWIMKCVCQRDSDKTREFLLKLSPPFFRSCISHSFYLLDKVDEIIQSVPDLQDPEETQRWCNQARLSLMKTFRRGISVPGRRGDAEDVVQACQALCNSKNFPRSSLLELKKLQAHYILNSDEPIHKLKRENLEFLLKLLEELVFVEKESRLTFHLMKVCVLVTGPRSYTLQQGLHVSEKWLEESRYNCLPYFYQMAIYFLKILEGNALEFLSQYSKALKMCREKSQNHCRSTQSTLFVGKDGSGMSQLITRNTLFLGETEYDTDDSSKVRRFWLTDSRKKLKECKGRINVGASSDRGKKTYPYISLIEGNLELYVGKNADIGKVERDFTPGTLVYFVVSFNLQGPVANGITFEPQRQPAVDH